MNFEGEDTWPDAIEPEEPKQAIDIIQSSLPIYFERLSNILCQARDGSKQLSFNATPFVASLASVLDTPASRVSLPTHHVRSRVPTEILIRILTYLTPREIHVLCPDLRCLLLYAPASTIGHSIDPNCHDNIIALPDHSSRRIYFDLSFVSLTTLPSSSPCALNNQDHDLAIFAQHSIQNDYFEQLASWIMSMMTPFAEVHFTIAPRPSPSHHVQHQTCAQGLNLLSYLGAVVGLFFLRRSIQTHCCHVLDMLSSIRADDTKRRYQAFQAFVQHVTGVKTNVISQFSQLRDEMASNDRHAISGFSVGTHNSNQDEVYHFGTSGLDSVSSPAARLSSSCDVKASPERIMDWETGYKTSMDTREGVMTTFGGTMSSILRAPEENQSPVQSSWVGWHNNPGLRLNLLGDTGAHFLKGLLLGDALGVYFTHMLYAQERQLRSEHACAQKQYMSHLEKLNCEVNNIAVELNTMIAESPSEIPGIKHMGLELADVSFPSLPQETKRELARMDPSASKETILHPLPGHLHVPKLDEDDGGLLSPMNPSQSNVLLFVERRTRQSNTSEGTTVANVANLETIPNIDPSDVVTMKRTSVFDFVRSMSCDISSLMGESMASNLAHNPTLLEQVETAIQHVARSLSLRTLNGDRHGSLISLKSIGPLITCQHNTLLGEGLGDWEFVYAGTQLAIRSTLLSGSSPEVYTSRMRTPSRESNHGSLISESFLTLSGVKGTRVSAQCLFPSLLYVQMPQSPPSSHPSSAVPLQDSFDKALASPHHITSIPRSAPTSLPNDFDVGTTTSLQIPPNQSRRCLKSITIRQLGWTAADLDYLLSACHAYFMKHPLTRFCLDIDMTQSYHTPAFSLRPLLSLPGLASLTLLGGHFHMTVLRHVRPPTFPRCLSSPSSSLSSSSASSPSTFSTTSSFSSSPVTSNFCSCISNTDPIATAAQHLTNCLRQVAIIQSHLTSWSRTSPSDPWLSGCAECNSPRNLFPFPLNLLLLYLLIPPSLSGVATASHSLTHLTLDSLSLSPSSTSTDSASPSTSSRSTSHLSCPHFPLIGPNIPTNDNTPFTPSPTTPRKGMGEKIGLKLSMWAESVGTIASTNTCTVISLPQSSPSSDDLYFDRHNHPLQHLALATPHVHHVVLRRLNALDDHAFSCCLRHWTRLRYLDIKGCRSISAITQVLVCLLNVLIIAAQSPRVQTDPQSPTLRQLVITSMLPTVSLIVQPASMECKYVEDMLHNYLTQFYGRSQIVLSQASGSTTHTVHSGNG